MTALALWLAYRPVVVERLTNGERTVFCIGDSYTFGLGVGQNSYPAVLENSLKSDDSSWRVINAGLPGQNSGDVLLALQNEFANSSPALVYIMVGHDDTWSRPEMFKPRSAIARNGSFKWRWRSVRFASLLVPVGKGLTSGGRRWISSLGRSIRYRGVDPSAAPLIGTWSFQGQIVQIHADHLLQMGNSNLEWDSHGNQMQVFPAKGSGDPTLRYVWEQREGHLFIKGDQFPDGVSIDRVPASMPASFITEEPRPDSKTGFTLAAHLRQMVQLAKAARSEVVLMSYPFHGSGDLNAIVGRVASNTGAGWIDIDDAFAKRLAKTRTANPYVENGHLSGPGYLLIANLVAADVRRRTSRH